MFENRGVRRTSDPTREEPSRGCRKMHTEELCNFHSSPNIIKVIKLRMRWETQIA
jgi:hypothetical protein